jgi:hypothetical protein
VGMVVIGWDVSALMYGIACHVARVTSNVPTIATIPTTRWDRDTIAAGAAGIALMGPPEAPLTGWGCAGWRRGGTRSRAPRRPASAPVAMGTDGGPTRASRPEGLLAVPAAGPPFPE